MRENFNNQQGIVLQKIYQRTFSALKISVLLNTSRNGAINECENEKFIHTGETQVEFGMFRELPLKILIKLTQINLHQLLPET